MVENILTQPGEDVTSTPATATIADSDVKSMQELVNQFGEHIKALKEGDVVAGNIVSVGKNEVIVSIPGIGMGVVRGRELYDDKIYLQNLKQGMEVYAAVVDPDNRDGNVELSFRQAGHERVWNKLKELKESQETIDTRILDANKGGLIVEVQGVVGFLPVSQLTTEHYPRVEEGDKSKILDALKSYVDQTFKVQVITADPKEEKLIVSEKSVYEEQLQKKLSKLDVNDIVEGEVTGITDFGVFVRFKHDQDLEGLVHISELAWQRIDDPSDIVNVGDEVKAKVISIEDNRISLSIKQLQPDPWQAVKDKYKVGDVVEGEVVKLLPFGAFVQLDTDIQGLAHIGELADPAPSDPSEVLKVGETRKFRIIEITPEEHRLGLSLNALGKKSSEQENKESIEQTNDSGKEAEDKQTEEQEQPAEQQELIPEKDEEKAE